MTLGDRDIFGEMERLRRELGSFSERMWSGWQASGEDQSWTPPVDIHEQDDALVLLVDLPGMKPDEIDLTVDHESLTIEGERLQSARGNGLRLERPMGRFRRSFRIGVAVNPDGVEATYRDGVLRVSVPRAAPQGPARVHVDVK
ncbi:MAG: Hsp20/alpha crystallin family protein [Armatimonadetes bacterium]|nr:Hsp20/alpha crystallin family protein [Armatimonadota bacterium]